MAYNRVLPPLTKIPPKTGSPPSPKIFYPFPQSWNFLSSSLELFKHHSTGGQKYENVNLMQNIPLATNGKANEIQRK